MTKFLTSRTIFIPRQQGLSLVELMIAIVLGLFLIWGVLQSFLTSRQAYNLQQGVGRIQENGRLAQEFLGFDIRNAGDYGCGSGDDFVTGDFDQRNGVCTAAVGTEGVNMISDTTFATTAFEYAVYGYDDVAANANVNGPGTNDITLGKVPIAGSDVLLVRVSEELGTLTAKVGELPPTAYTTLSGVDFPIHKGLAADLPDNQPVAISDCGRTKIFALDEADKDDTDLQLSGANFCFFSGFQQGASVRKLTTVYYFVAASVSGKTTSLYRQVGEGATPEELLEGVENMQLEYGVDTNGDSVINSWETADDVTDAMWNAWDGDNDLVRAVRYSLLLVTEAAVLGETQSFTYNGNAVPDDRRLRQVFTSSIGIRSLLNPDH